MSETRPHIRSFEQAPTEAFEILISISAIIQTILFGYHLSNFECKQENPKWINYMSLCLALFFILAIIITEMGFTWCMVDLTIYSLEGQAQFVIYYIGICLVYIGNISFLWIEYYSTKGLQSPWYQNDIGMHRMDVDIRELIVKDVDINNNKINDEGKLKLVTSGPFRCCRHPIVPILLFWEFGYGLSTGAWFEFLAFVSFVSVELLHINTIEKSLLFKYGKEYYEYMMSKSAFVPFGCGKYLGIEMGLFNRCCICLCLFGDYKRSKEQIPLTVHDQNSKKRTMNPSYGTV